MKKIKFTELNFAGYEHKIELEVDEYRTTKNQNGTYNIICKIGTDKKIFNNCTYPKHVKPEEKSIYAWNDAIHELNEMFKKNRCNASEEYPNESR